ncbi:hypothetical protein, partial [Brevibacillus borstelensis]|uniref:hypothetical protein n=1 Tax=Brevibacillus borstelensis TaxID=45462 RepID=UPI001C0F4A12
MIRELSRCRTYNNKELTADTVSFRLSRNPTICWSFFFHNNKIEHEVLEVLDSTTPNMPLQGG